VVEENELLAERHGHVLLLTLNRHPKRNALGLAMLQGLVDALNGADADPDT